MNTSKKIVIFGCSRKCKAFNDCKVLDRNIDMFEHDKYMPDHCPLSSNIPYIKDLGWKGKGLAQYAHIELISTIGAYLLTNTRDGKFISYFSQNGSKFWKGEPCQTIDEAKQTAQCHFGELLKKFMNI